CDVAVVVEARDEDLVAGTELATDGAREREIERRHVRSEDDLLGRAAEEPGRRRTRPVEQLPGAPARVVRPADIGVRLPQVGGDRQRATRQSGEQEVLRREIARELLRVAVVGCDAVPAVERDRVVEDLRARLGHPLNPMPSGPVTSVPAWTGSGRSARAIATP